MSPLRLSLGLFSVISLSACGLGETATSASLQAKQAQQAQAQAQVKQLQEQINQANAVNQQRLQQELSQQQ